MTGSVSDLLSETNRLLRRLVEPIHIEDIWHELSQEEQEMALSAKLSTMTLQQVAEYDAERQGLTLEEYLDRYLRQNDSPRPNVRSVYEVAGVAP